MYFTRNMRRLVLLILAIQGTAFLLIYRYQISYGEYIVVGNEPRLPHRVLKNRAQRTILVGEKGDEFKVQVQGGDQVPSSSKVADKESISSPHISLLKNSSLSFSKELVQTSVHTKGHEPLSKPSVGAQNMPTSIIIKDKVDKIGSKENKVSDHIRRLKSPVLESEEDANRHALPEAESKESKVSSNRIRRLKPPVLNQLVSEEDANRRALLEAERKKRLMVKKVDESIKEESSKKLSHKQNYYHTVHKLSNSQIKKTQRVKQIQNLNKDYRNRLVKDPNRYFKAVCNSTLEPLVECYKSPVRNLTQLEAAGDDIMFTMRTTMKYHETRLDVLFDTWLGDVKPENMFIVTDGKDEDLEWKLNTLGMNFVNIHTGTSHNRSDLCCKAGVELELLLKPAHSNFNWLCHVDDDMYIIPKSLVKILSHFDPTKEKVYFGRSGSPWAEPRTVKNESLLGKPGMRYHFAVGGMYCMSRLLLEAAKPYLIGCSVFRESCSKTQEPEDVTVGLVVGTMLNEKLHRTEMIYTHGLELLSSTSSNSYLGSQIAFSYGFGAIESWNVIPNVVYVPRGLFNLDEDISQFKSLHCHLYPNLQWCLEKKQQVAEELLHQSKNDCLCSWKKLICCKVYQDNYKKMAEARMLKQLAIS